MSITAISTPLITSARRVGTPAGSGQTVLELIDAIDGGPEYHWRMDTASPSTTMAARVGGINGTWFNTADMDYQVGAITQNPDGGTSMGFDGGVAPSPSHARITIGGGGISIASQHTFHQFVQLDRHKGKHVMLTTGQTVPQPSIAGEFAREFIDDGAGGMKPRVWTVNASGVPVIYVGASNGTVPIGQAFSVTWIQQNGSLAVRINGVNVPLTLDSGTPPGTWAAAPAGILYVGAWPTGIDSFDGIASELALWNSYVFTAPNSASLNIPQSLVWLEDFDAGSVPTSQTANISLAAHAHPSFGFVPTVESQGGFGVASVDGEGIEYVAASTPGNDSFTASIAIGPLESLTRTITIDVGSGVGYLPYRGRLYGCALGVFGHGNIIMNDAENSFFFIAQKTGTVTTIFGHERIGVGYSTPSGTGDHGTYNIDFHRADSTTQLSTSARLGGRVNYVPTTAAVLAAYPVITLTDPVDTVEGQGYIIAYRRQSGGNFSQNVCHQVSFWDNSWPITNYVEPGRGPGAGFIVCESSANTIEPQNVGAVAARIRGWTPHVVDGQQQFPFPVAMDNQTRLGRRLGTPELALVYGDGDIVNSGGWGSNFPNSTNSFPGGSTLYRVAISGNVQARIRFKVTRATRTASGIFVKAVRTSTAAGDFVVSLESGVTTDAVAPDQNGAQFLEVSCNSNLFLNINDTGQQIEQIDQNNTGSTATSLMHIAHWVWIPFPTPITLSIGQFYIVRMRCTGTVTVALHAGHRASSFFGTSGRSLTWTQWEAQRQESGETWEDCKDGTEASSNAGGVWQVLDGQLSPVCFKTA